MKVWSRYLFFRTSKFFVFFFCVICLLFVFIDFSTHGQKLSQEVFSFISFYYLFQIAEQLDLFINLSFVLAVLKTLIDANARFELVAFQSAGISKKKLLTPFLLLAFICSTFLILNAEFSFPYLQKKLSHFSEVSFLQKEKKRKKLLQIHLKDRSYLVFSSYDKKKKKLFDVYWVTSTHSFWHMKTFQFFPSPKGFFVDHFDEDIEGKIKKISSYEQKFFPSLNMDDTKVSLFFTPLLHRKLSQFFRYKDFFSSSDRSILLANFHHKIMMSCVPLVFLLNLFPLLSRFSKKAFFHCVISLFLLFLFFMASKALLFLGENEVLSPFFAGWSFFILFSLSGIVIYLRRT